MNNNSNLIRVGILGDYGRKFMPPEYVAEFGNETGESRIANLVKHEYPFYRNSAGGNLDFIITLGDNNYNDGQWSTIDDNIGDFFADWIYPFNGNSTRSVDAPNWNRMFCTLGNHDYDLVSSSFAPYLKYFEGILPPNGTSAPVSANGRYYDFVRGNVHFFALNSNKQEPDGRDSKSIQANWTRDAMKRSTSVFKVVYFHHLPFSNTANAQEVMRWPFKEWGADVVLTGHAHVAEKFFIDELYYITLGMSGTVPFDPTNVKKSFGDFVPGTKYWFNATWAAQLMEADACSLNITLITLGGIFSDVTYILPKESDASRKAGCSRFASTSNSNQPDEQQQISQARNEGVAIGIGASVGFVLIVGIIYYYFVVRRREKNLESKEYHHSFYGTGNENVVGTTRRSSSKGVRRSLANQEQEQRQHQNVEILDEKDNC